MRIAPWTLAAVLTATTAATTAPGQLAQRSGSSATTSAPAAPRRTRLILKDGSYQLIMGYTVVGNRVRFISAERGGDTEEIPLALVDLPATELWATQHAPADPDAPAASRPAPALDPELVKEEAERAALSPEVAPDLRLEPQDSVLGLDTFRGSPDLVPLTQAQGDVARQNSHNILRGTVNPLSAAHQVVVIKGERAAVQFHVPDPVFYLKLDDELPSSGEALTVDTHGASTQAGKTRLSTSDDYVIVRVDVRQDARVVASFNISALGTDKRQDDVIEVTPTVLPGGHWMKLVPDQQLLFGEYALVEVLGAKEINLGVWDFGVHPTAPENRDLIKPEKRRPTSLEHRTPEP